MVSSWLPKERWTRDVIIFDLYIYIYIWETLERTFAKDWYERSDQTNTIISVNIYNIFEIDLSRFYDASLITRQSVCTMTYCRGMRNTIYVHNRRLFFYILFLYLFRKKINNLESSLFLISGESLKISIEQFKALYNDLLNYCLIN